ncbi:MAG: hypothetical protein JWP59_4465, partial [Massilia sp.]|nr:hypothetical protein [Massilia sp.]
MNYTLKKWLAGMAMAVSLCGALNASAQDAAKPAGAATATAPAAVTTVPVADPAAAPTAA